MMDKSVLELTRHLPRLSLQKMSLFRIVTILCNNRQLIELILKCDFEKYFPFRLSSRMEKKWEAVAAMANELVSQICNSDLLKKKILEQLWPVSYRILVWKSTYHLYISNEFLNHFYWTDRGRIDNTRTVKCIIGNKNIPVRERFFLACSVCIDKEITEIRTEMANEDKLYFLEKKRGKLSALFLFWVHTLIGSKKKVIDAFMYGALPYASKGGLLEAIKYLFSISAEDKRKEMADVCMNIIVTKAQKNFFLEEDQNDIVYFVFFEMTYLRQDHIFNSCPEIIFSLLLHSTEYKLCLDLVVERLQSVSERAIATFLRLIFYSYHLEIANVDDCRKLFVDVWRGIPTSRKSSMTESGVAFLCALIRDNFPFLLKTEETKIEDELTVLDFKSLVSVKQINFNHYKWSFLHFLIDEEVVTAQRLERDEGNALFFLQSCYFLTIDWNRILSFVRKVGTLQ